MKPLGIGIRSRAAVARGQRRSTPEYERCLGLGAECTKASAAASGRRRMSLDIPSYRTSEQPAFPFPCSFSMLLLAFVLVVARHMTLNNVARDATVVPDELVRQSGTGKIGFRLR